MTDAADITELHQEMKMNKPAEQLPARIEPASVPATITPMDLLQQATASGADLDKMQQLMDLQERWEASQARKSFFASMQQFEPPVIIKNKQVKFGNTEYKHASHDQVVTAIGAALAKVGITHRWSISQDNGNIAVTCELSHVDGHIDRTTMSGSSDTSGGKNSIQAIASTTTYLQRYTLLAATGVAAQDDDDGHAASADPITDKQLSVLTDMANDVDADQGRFLKYLGVEKLSDLPASEYQKAVAALKAKKDTKK